MTCYATFFLFLFGSSIIFCSRFPLRTYYYVNSNMTWSDAQQFCRMNYDDLATIENMSDISLLKPNFSYSWAWIGLFDDQNNWQVHMGNASNSWRWSATGETSKTGYQSWGTSIVNPNSRDANENCATMSVSGLWYDMACQSPRSVVCSNVTQQNQIKYVFVSNTMSWSSAQAYCRKHYSDLTTIENSAENTAINSVKPATTLIWTGLYRVPWIWSDNSHSPFKYWLSGQPDNAKDSQFCVAENALHQWADYECASTFPFICHRVSKLTTRLRMFVVSDTDITNEDYKAQILKKLDTVLTSHGWTDFNLQLKIREKKDRKPKDPLCNMYL